MVASAPIRAVLELIDPHTHQIAASEVHSAVEGEL